MKNVVLIINTVGSRLHQLLKSGMSDDQAAKELIRHYEHLGEVI